MLCHTTRNFTETIKRYYFSDITFPVLQGALW
jgi:hypothetical protein